MDCLHLFKCKQSDWTVVSAWEKIWRVSFLILKNVSFHGNWYVFLKNVYYSHKVHILLVIIYKSIFIDFLMLTSFTLFLLHDVENIESNVCYIFWHARLLWRNYTNYAVSLCISFFLTVVSLYCKIIILKMVQKRTETFIL